MVHAAALRPGTLQFHPTQPLATNDPYGNFFLATDLRYVLKRNSELT